jgi:tetratricopeptide (TPR) repeat protein
VVLQNLAFSFAPVWHYAVVVGYDLPREEIVLRSGTTRRLEMRLSTFERVWARGGHWAMVALPPQRLPVTAAADTYVAAVVALERLDAAAARQAYAAALARWPDHLLAEIGLGNTAYAARDLAAAEAAYRRATNDHPQAADAWNNLAQVLFELRRTDEAQSAAERAVALGGPRLASYQATLKAITEPR